MSTYNARNIVVIVGASMAPHALLIIWFFFMWKMSHVRAIGMNKRLCLFAVYCK